MREEKFKEALVAYLQGRYDESQSLCRTLLRHDPDDVEATLQLAAVAARRGDAAGARCHLLRARYLDDEGVWDAHVERQLAAVSGPPEGKNREPALGVAGFATKPVGI
jgi:predicted Zn-dependent protease